jgi:hypothetical protein
MRYMGSALGAFKDAASPIVAMRTVQSSDAPNMWYSRRKGRFGFALNFPDGTCHLFGWHEEGAEQQPSAKRCEGNGADPETSAEIMKARFAEIDDGIPEFLRRT